MYLPEAFEEPRIEVMHELIRAYPLATLITQSSDGLNANHIPLHLSTVRAPYGTLCGHVARANPVWKDLEQNSAALAVFVGPDCYISPSWYATKAETGKVVPTWNYAVVHVHGQIRIIHDAVWLRAQLDALTAHNEADFAEPWSVSDAPADFTDKLLGAIVGVELVIERMQGKWKVSQNQPARNRSSVVAGLRQSDDPAARAMAALVDAWQKNETG